MDTEVLFRLLLRFVPVDLVFDIGSFDGTHAVRFHRTAPRARVVAFEAHPDLAERLKASPALKAAGIAIEHAAVGNREGLIPFHIEHAPESPGEAWRQQISSTRARVRHSAGSRLAEVPGVRLDRFISESHPGVESVALWIDAEGGAYEVLEGASSVSRRLRFVHIEVETVPLWTGQRLRRDVVTLARRVNLVPFAQGLGMWQHDMVFVSNAMLDRYPRRLSFLARLAQVISFLQRTKRRTLRRRHL